MIRCPTSFWIALKDTEWVVFEPNDAVTWAKVRLQVEAYLTRKWRAGDLVGATPAEAFLVRCGPDTMTQSDLDDGRMIIEIGFAPFKPAEFVIIRITQFAESR